MTRTLIAILILIAATADVRADAPGGTTSRRVPGYRTHVAVADVVSSALFITGAVMLSGQNDQEVLGDVLVGAGIAGYLVGPPVIHAALGTRRRALTSLGLRVATPLVAGLAGAGIAELRGCSGELCNLFGFVEGAAVGVGLAMIADAINAGPFTVQVSREQVVLGLAGGF